MLVCRADDVQVELVMLDPYIRSNLSHNEQVGLLGLGPRQDGHLLERKTPRRAIFLQGLGAVQPLHALPDHSPPPPSVLHPRPAQRGWPPLGSGHGLRSLQNRATTVATRVRVCCPAFISGTLPTYHAPIFRGAAGSWGILVSHLLDVACAVLTMTLHLQATFSTQVKVPDQYGVFKWVLQYHRQGYSYIDMSETVPIRPFRHDEYERFILQVRRGGVWNGAGGGAWHNQLCQQEGTALGTLVDV